MASKITFVTPQKFVDGTTIPADQLATAVYSVQIDTVNPPVKSFLVPAAVVAAGVVEPDGTRLVTVLFTDVGFVPVANTKYFVAASDSVSGVASAESADVSFTNSVAPNPPSAVSVS